MVDSRSTFDRKAKHTDAGETEASQVAGMSLRPSTPTNHPSSLPFVETFGIPGAPMRRRTEVDRRNVRRSSSGPRHGDADDDDDDRGRIMWSPRARRSYRDRDDCSPSPPSTSSSGGPVRRLFTDDPAMAASTAPASPLFGPVLGDLAHPAYLAGTSQQPHDVARLQRTSMSPGNSTGSNSAASLGLLPPMQLSRPHSQWHASPSSPQQRLSSQDAKDSTDSVSDSATRSASEGGTRRHEEPVASSRHNGRCFRGVCTCTARRLKVGMDTSTQSKQRVVTTASTRFYPSVVLDIQTYRAPTVVPMSRHMLCRAAPGEPDAKRRRLTSRWSAAQ